MTCCCSCCSYKKLKISKVIQNLQYSQCFFLFFKQMSKEADPLIKLAALELNIDLKSVSANCAPMCDQLYDYAGEDGHNLMTAFPSGCVCSKPKPVSPKPIQKP